MPPTNGSNRQETPKSPNFPRFSLLFILIIISLLIAPSFRTDNIFNICVFFATFTTLIYALTDLIIYLSKEPPHPTTLHINSVEKGNKKTTKNFLSTAVKKAVHHIQQCRVAVSRVMRSIFRNKWLIGIFAIALSFPASLTLTEHWKEIAGKITAVLEFFIIENKSLGISILITFIVALIIFHKKIITTFQKFISGLTSKYFIFTLATLAIIGASSALLIPSYTSWFREPGYTSAQQDSAKETLEKVQETPAPTASPTGNKAAEVEQKSTSDLRLHLLYVTGGIIAILGLIETNRKNSQDHIRQVHTTRRDRYIEAVDKLSSENAPVRLGGVYALVGLVDEWLDDDNIDEKTQTKEGQVIINNLCSYIRSPFPYAKEAEEYNARKELEDLETKDSENLSMKESERRAFLLERFEGSAEYNEPENITEIQAKVLEEQGVRLAIFTEMSKRSGTLDTSRKEIVPGSWSKFEFDFSQAPIFYPLNNLTIEKPNFSSSKFYGQADFSNTIFPQDQNFSKAIFEDTPILDKIKFAKTLNFSEAIFKQKINFTKTVFEHEIKFDGATFEKDLLIWDADFSQSASFKETVFKGGIHFNRTKFRSIVNFSGSNFKGAVNFRYVLFGKFADFSEAVFSREQPPGARRITDHPKLPLITRDVKFIGATFAEEATFKKARFEDGANFSGATFGKSLDFTDTYGNTIFSSSDGKKAFVTKFSVNTVCDAYKFKRNYWPPNEVGLGKATLHGKTFEIPLGSVLFDPGSWDKENQEYTRFSDPAK